jgi:hypothetical protein
MLAQIFSSLEYLLTEGTTVRLDLVSGPLVTQQFLSSSIFFLTNVANVVVDDSSQFVFVRVRNSFVAFQVFDSVEGLVTHLADEALVAILRKLLVATKNVIFVVKCGNVKMKIFPFSETLLTEFAGKRLLSMLRPHVV